MKANKKERREPEEMNQRFADLLVKKLPRLFSFLQTPHFALPVAQTHESYNLSFSLLFLTSTRYLLFLSITYQFSHYLNIQRGQCMKSI